MNFTDSLVPVILIADDELIVRNVAAAMLAGQGYIVLTAEDGFEAADLIEDFQGVINLVFCDMRMPGPSGMELRERILSRRPATKVVLLSGDTAFVGVPPDVVTFPKPFSSAWFRTFVRKMP